MTIDDVIQLFDGLRWLTGCRNGEVVQSTSGGPLQLIRVAGLYRGCVILVEGRTVREVIQSCVAHRYRIDYEAGLELSTRIAL